MAAEPCDYAFQTLKGGWRITGSRVSLDSVVYAYMDGQSPETIVEDFPTLTLEQVHGALAFYLRHRAQIDSYLAEQSAMFENLRQQQRDDPLLNRLRKAKEAAASSRKTG